MLFSTFSAAVVALAALVPSLAASPLAVGSEQLQTRSKSPNLSRLAKMMPTSTLPAPDGLQLKFVVLGVGTQNYTCSPDAPTATPLNLAVATLYDIGTRLNTDPLAKWKLGSITPLALGMSMNLKVLQGYLVSQGYQNQLGNHFFTGGAPTFALNKVKENPTPLALCKKINFQDAPTGSCPGLKQEGAVQWVQLSDNGGSQGGVNMVYRLETAGGKAPAGDCAGMKPSFQVPYAAQYWIFGPKD